MQEMRFEVATPDDFGPVITLVLEKLKEATTAASASPTNPTPPSADATVAASSGVVTLTGDLGAGKTTFVQQLAKRLGVTEPITSPTFGIMKGYKVPDGAAVANLVHIDAYRIEDISEAGPLRLEELWQQPRNLICIEWPERIEAILPENRIDISIEITEGERRRVIVQY